MSIGKNVPEVTSLKAARMRHPLIVTHPNIHTQEGVVIPMPTKKTDNVVGYRRESDIVTLKEEIKAEILQEMRKKEPAPREPAVSVPKQSRKDLQARIGRNIRAIRERVGLSQSEVARKLPKGSPARINNIEGGRVGVSVPYLQRISEILGCDVGELFNK